MVMENVSEPSIRVAVVDDHIMVSEMLALSISKEPDLSLVGIVGNGRRCTRASSKENTPTSYLLNYRLPDFECIEVIKLMVKESPDSRVVMLSGNGDHELQCLATEAGCTGLLGKNAQHLPTYSRAIRAAMRGESSSAPASRTSAATPTLYSRLRGLDASSRRSNVITTGHASGRSASFDLNDIPDTWVL